MGQELPSIRAVQAHGKCAWKQITWTPSFITGSFGSAPFRASASGAYAGFFDPARAITVLHGLANISMYFASGTNPQLISPLFMFYMCTCYLMARQLPKFRVPMPERLPTASDALRDDKAARPVPLPGWGWER